MKTQHLYTNFRIVVTGDTATCKSHFMGQHFLAGFAGGDEFHLRGEYEDTLIRDGNEWRISGMTFTLFYTTGNAALLAQ